MRTKKVTQKEFLREFHWVDFSHNTLCYTFDSLNLLREFQEYWKKINTKKFNYTTTYFEKYPSIEESYFLRCLVAIEFLRSIDMLEE